MIFYHLLHNGFLFQQEISNAVWGKIFGAATGMALSGNIVGAVIGAMAGHAIDRYRSAALEHSDKNKKKTAWSFSYAPAEQLDLSQIISFTALAAKLCKSDGRVNTVEIKAFKEIIKPPPNELRRIGQVFDNARREIIGFESYADQIAKLCDYRRDRLEEVLSGLFIIARADAPVNPSEIQFLRRVSMIFGFHEYEFSALMVKFGVISFSQNQQQQKARTEQQYQDRAQEKPTPPPPPNKKYYDLLGVKKEQSEKDIKIAYRKLVRELHPDTLMAKGASATKIEESTRKLAEINAAYDQICKERNFN
ncbi:MAG: TerB family tellurite resistance protein [Alphaproteobacteria bacterium]